MQHFKQQTAQDASMAKPADESNKQAGEKRLRSCGEAPNSIDLQPQKCPRCSSFNTKFCYYNNYSLSQPRHFCKNCRRYWTRGGTLRNVPIGGGCRKNKKFKPQQQQPLRSTMDNGSNFISSTGSFMHLPTPCAGPSALSYNLSANESTGSTNSLGMTFSCLQESVRPLGGQLRADSPSLFNFLPPTSISSNCYSTGYPGFNPASKNMELASSLPLRESEFKTYVAGKETQNIAQNHNSSIFLSSSIGTKLDDLPGTASTSRPAISSSQFLSKMGEHLLSFNSVISATASIDEPHHYNLGVGSTGPGPEGHVEDQDALDIREAAMLCVMKERLPAVEDFHAAELDHHGLFGSLASEASLWTASWPEMHAALGGTTTTAGALLH